MSGSFAMPLSRHRCVGSMVLLSALGAWGCAHRPVVAQQEATVLPAHTAPVVAAAVPAPTAVPPQTTSVGTSPAREPHESAVSGTSAATAPTDPWATQRRAPTTSIDALGQTADPASGAPALQVVGPASAVLPPQGSQELTYQATPGATVLFVATEGGLFPNGQSSIALVADAQGRVSTQFSANSGTVDDANIQVGTSSCVGIHKFICHIRHPESSFERLQPPASMP